MKKEGGCEWYQLIGLKFDNISVDKIFFLNEHGPLKSIKRI